MKSRKNPIGFEVSMSTRNDGTIEAVYIYFSHQRAHHTEEIIEDILVADYDKQGVLIGIEVLAPVKISDLTRLVENNTQKTSLRKFLRAKQDAFDDFVYT